MKDNLTKMIELLATIKKTNDSITKRRCYDDMVKLYKKDLAVKEMWEHHPSEHFIRDRFVIRKKPLAVIKDRPNTRRKKAFEDGINYNVPCYGGLYLIGSTHFNPLTKEEFYWIKVGRSSYLPSRMSDYSSTSPMCYRIGFKKIENEEKRKEAETQYHQALNWLSIACCGHNKEWFLVSREIYLSICKEGFSYFD